MIKKFTLDHETMVVTNTDYEVEDLIGALWDVRNYEGPGLRCFAVIRVKEQNLSFLVYSMIGNSYVPYQEDAERVNSNLISWMFPQRTYYFANPHDYIVPINTPVLFRFDLARFDQELRQCSIF